MYKLKVKRIRLNEDNNDLIYSYLPKNYIEIKQIKNVENPQLKSLQEQLQRTTNDRQKEHLEQRIAKLPIIKEVYYTIYSDISYEKLVVKFIREKYNADEESAIQRKAIMNGVSDEFLTYNAYVEECKVRARAFVEERELSGYGR